MWQLYQKPRLRFYPTLFLILSELFLLNWQDFNKALEGDVWAVTLPLVEFYLLATYKASRTLTPLAQHVPLPPFSFAGVAATCWEGSI